MAVGMREPWGVLECGGRRWEAKRHAALAYVGRASPLEAICGME
jgi:hypothetical protein